MARRKHAAHGAKHREAGKNCIRCGEDLDLTGTTQEHEDGNVGHWRDDERIAVTAEPREYDDGYYSNRINSYEGGLYCEGCNNAIEERRDLGDNQVEQPRRD